MPRTTRPTNKFVDYIAAQMDLSEKTQAEMCQELGYTKPNVISMFKKGWTKVPMEKVPKLAEVLGVDPTHLMNLWLQTYAPDLYVPLQTCYGRVVTDNEWRLIQLFRKVTKDKNPHIPNAAIMEKALKDGLSA